MLRRMLVTAALTLGIGVLPVAAAHAAVVAQADVSAFCQARLDLSAAVALEDNDAAKLAATALETAAPPEVQEASGTLAAAVERKGHKATDSKKGRRALVAIDDFVASGCGFPTTAVTAVDYTYQGVPDTLPPGGHVIQLTNDAPKEVHELVLMKVKAGVRLSAKKLAALSGKQAGKKLELVGVVVADPGESATLVVPLTPGRYVSACYVPVGGKPAKEEHDEHGGGGGDVKHHWKKGMLATIEVAGA